MTVLIERLSHKQANVKSRIVEGEDGGKNMFMEGIFVQGNVKNANQRVYPVAEITRAVESVQSKISEGFPVLGECDHPPELTVNVDRVSHIIENMWMDGPNGYGKLKIVPTPMGNIIRTLIESGATLGVSSRGSGEVGHDGNVKNFEIVCRHRSTTKCSRCLPEGNLRRFNEHAWWLPNLATSTECTNRQGRSKILVRTNR